MKRAKQTNVRLSLEGHRLLWLLSDTLGVTKTAVLELALRALAKQEDVALPRPTQEG